MAVTELYLIYKSFQAFYNPVQALYSLKTMPASNSVPQRLATTYSYYSSFGDFLPRGTCSNVLPPPGTSKIRVIRILSRLKGIPRYVRKLVRGEQVGVLSGNHPAIGKVEEIDDGKLLHEVHLRMSAAAIASPTTWKRNLRLHQGTWSCREEHRRPQA